MLKGIPKILTPDLLRILAEMGHGDEIVIADANFPANSVGQRVIRCDGHSVLDVLEAVLQLFPLDTFVDSPAALMQRVEGDTTPTPIWDDFRTMVSKHTDAAEPLEFEERFAFYERAKKAYAVVSTGESKKYANIILKKGIIVD